MSTAPSKRQSLIHTIVPEADLKTDLELHDRFTGFSSELARLAMLSLAGIGWIAGKDLERRADLQGSALWPIVIGVVFACASVFASLLHRFWATDALAFQVRARRLHKAVAEGTREESEQKEEERGMRWRLRASGRSLIVAWTLMALSVASIGAGLVLTLVIDGPRGH